MVGSPRKAQRLIYSDRAMALCRIQDPDRKGKVEAGVGHAQKTPLKGLCFESLEEAQAYPLKLDPLLQSITQISVRSTKLS